MLQLGVLCSAVWWTGRFCGRKKGRAWGRQRRNAALVGWVKSTELEASAKREGRRESGMLAYEDLHFEFGEFVPRFCVCMCVHVWAYKRGSQMIETHLILVQDLGWFILTLYFLHVSTHVLNLISFSLPLSTYKGIKSNSVVWLIAKQGGFVCDFIWKACSLWCV